MSYWENNPSGICEDAPCCGCCGPQGDGRYSDEPPEPDDDYDPWDDDNPDEDHECYMGHRGCYDEHWSERRADEADWEQERLIGS